MMPTKPTGMTGSATQESQPEVIETGLTGRDLLGDPYLNKGSAFPEEERDAFGLHGLLPGHCSTMDQQLQRTYENFQAKNDPLEKYIFLASLQDRNEILFYRLLQTHIAEMMPIVYTPTVGEACQRYSHIFRRARGLYLSHADLHRIPQILREAAPAEVSVIVVTDGERILGLGDLGVGGMGIPVGKLALYTLCAGLDPRKTLPVFLDVGTNNPDLLKDPLYLGWRHPRLEREEYDRFVDQFVEAVRERWPRAILQWEDFSKNNAWRLLQRHRDHLASFNDDIQGTAAVTLAGLLRALRSTGRTWKEQRIVMAGAGSAATGIGTLLIRAMQEEGVEQTTARAALWLVDTQGLVHRGRANLSEEKMAFAQTPEQVHAFGLDPEHTIALESVVKAVTPTILLGTTGQPGMFYEHLVRTMAGAVERPIIFPLSNPTSKSEATPRQLFQWTEGRALVATGSPFEPVPWKGGEIPVGQCNNAFIFPGVGLGLMASAARLVPEEAFYAAAKALAKFDERLPGYQESLFPNLEHVREISEKIAIVVGQEVIRRGLSHESLREDQIPERVRQLTWNPTYPTLRLAARD